MQQADNQPFILRKDVVLSRGRTFSPGRGPRKNVTEWARSSKRVQELVKAHLHANRLPKGGSSLLRLIIKPKDGLGEQDSKKVIHAPLESGYIPGFSPLGGFESGKTVASFDHRVRNQQSLTSHPSSGLPAQAAMKHLRTLTPLNPVRERFDSNSALS